jgi:hypothetical protein
MRRSRAVKMKGFASLVPGWPRCTRFLKGLKQWNRHISRPKCGQGVSLPFDPAAHSSPTFRRQISLLLFLSTKTRFCLSRKHHFNQNRNGPHDLALLKDRSSARQPPLDLALGVSGEGNGAWFWWPTIRVILLRSNTPNMEPQIINRLDMTKMIQN